MKKYFTQKNNFCITNKKSNQFDFIIIQELFFWVKHNEASLVQNVLLFSELHDVKTEGSTSCKELFDKQCPLVYYRKK